VTRALSRIAIGESRQPITRHLSAFQGWWRFPVACRRAAALRSLILVSLRFTLVYKYGAIPLCLGLMLQLST